MCNDHDEKSIDQLLENNRRWSAKVEERQPGFFASLEAQQKPDYLWIGCSDSRVPANEIVDLLPGELFVHRNVGNLVLPGDLNCMAVMQYAVDVLGVKHIIVTGHYGCGAVKAAMSQTPNDGMIDGWIHNIKIVNQKHREKLNTAASEEERLNLLCEYNVMEQVASVSQTPIVQKAWARGQELTVHGLVYSLKDGILKDLGVRVTNASQTPASYHILETAPNFS